MKLVYIIIAITFSAGERIEYRIKGSFDNPVSCMQHIKRDILPYLVLGPKDKFRCLPAWEEKDTEMKQKGKGTV